MTGMGRRQYLRAIHARYQRSKPAVKGSILDEFCSVCGYNRKYAIRLLSKPCPGARPGPRRSRGPSYGREVIEVLARVWEAAGYPWSVRLKALLPLWLPWLRQRRAVSAETERQLLAISPRQIDRRLKPRKTELPCRVYGGTKPGTRLQHPDQAKQQASFTADQSFLLGMKVGNPAGPVNFVEEPVCDQQEDADRN